MQRAMAPKNITAPIIIPIILPIRGNINLKTIIANIIPAIIRKITNHSIDTFLYRYSYISL
ncbi:hypothetical protein PUATCC27989T_01734 [Phytobacter ursingii]|nr:hypothetical protein PUATCC27989T_01734 [Phytobacter ursingii]